MHLQPLVVVVFTLVCSLLLHLRLFFLLLLCQLELSEESMDFSRFQAFHSRIPECEPEVGRQRGGKELKRSFIYHRDSHQGHWRGILTGDAGKQQNKELTNSGMKNTSGMVVKILEPLGRNCTTWVVAIVRMSGVCFFFAGMREVTFFRCFLKAAFFTQTPPFLLPNLNPNQPVWPVLLTVCVAW